jgi:polyhydroxyalkanoic acid synthase PhaR subunit
MTQNLDMFEMWKNYFNQSSTLIDEKMKEQFPSQAMGQILDMNLMFQKMLNETTDRYFEQMNVPTRTDIAKISSLIVNVDTKVDDLEDLLEETRAKQLNHAELQSEIKDFGKEIKSLDAKLNQILTQVNSLIEVNNKKAADINEAAEVNPAEDNKEAARITTAANNKEVTKISAATKNRRSAKNKVAGNNKKTASNKDEQNSL